MYKYNIVVCCVVSLLVRSWSEKWKKLIDLTTTTLGGHEETKTNDYWYVHDYNKKRWHDCECDQDNNM